MLPPNFIIIWPSTNASIPTGWTRETTLDDKYPKATANATDPNVTGGNATHTHTSSAHSHTMDSHSHTVVTTDVSGNRNSSDNAGTESYANPHHHTVSVAGLNNGGLSSVTSTYGAVSNDPPYITTIFIKSANYRGIPASAVVLWNTAFAPTGFDYCDGASGRPDYRNRYLKGASAGADAGTTGGSLTNVHALTHTHTESTHYHNQTISGGISASGIRMKGGSGFSSLGHSHTYTTNATTAGTISTNDLTTLETVEPAFKQIAAVQNTSGVTKNPVNGIIGLWLGTLASIPQGIFLCDGNNGTPDMRDKFLKIINTTAGLGGTGGSNTHAHASQSHSHTGASHTHTNNGSNFHHGSEVAEVGGSTAVTQPGDYAQHSGFASVSSTAVSWGSANTTGDATTGEASQPEFRTVAYVMFKYFASGLLVTML